MRKLEEQPKMTPFEEWGELVEVIDAFQESEAAALDVEEQTGDGQALGRRREEKEA